MIFIGTSNEFGQFESGVTAQWFGAVPAVILGGAGTLVVIALWAWWFLNSGMPENYMQLPAKHCKVQRRERPSERVFQPDF